MGCAAAPDRIRLGNADLSGEKRRLNAGVAVSCTL